MPDDPPENPQQVCARLGHQWKEDTPGDGHVYCGRCGQVL